MQRSQWGQLARHKSQTNYPAQAKKMSLHTIFSLTFTRNSSTATQELFKVTLTPTLPDSCAEASSSALCDLKTIRPQIQDAANRVWQNYVSSERRTSQRDAEKANQVSGRVDWAMGI